jgi:hypothetical protein
MRRLDRRDWPDADELRALRASLGLTQLARALHVSRSVLTHHLNNIDGRDNTRQIVRSDDRFSARMRAAMDAGTENPFSASANAVKPGPWRPKRIHGIAERSYTGSSAAWAAQSE